jgi:membrane fusion protein (multidrug efflux system)
VREPLTIINGHFMMISPVRRRLFVGAASLALTGALALSGCNKTPAPGQGAPGAPGATGAENKGGENPGGGGGGGGRGGRGGGGAPVSVTTTAVQHMPVQRRVDLAGTLLSPDQAKVELELALARAESALRQTRAQLGIVGPVTESDTLPPDDEIGSVKNALASMLDAKANAERSRYLSGKNLISAVDLQTAETRLKVAEAAYQSAVDNIRGQKALLQDRRASYDLAKKKVNDATVRAPIAGVVSDRPVQVGEYISERAYVATIVQINPLKLRTGVQERFAGVVQGGQSVEFRVESFPDAIFKGKVAFVSPALDQTMRTFTVEALVDNGDRRLKPGFFAKGSIMTKVDEGVTAVPDAAVSTLAGVSSVYVIKDGKVTQTQITLGVRQGDLWEVVDGLKGDETLATSRLNELATGSRVTPDGAAGGGGGRGGRGGGRRGGGQGDGANGGGAMKGDQPAGGPDAAAGKDGKSGAGKDGKSGDGKGGDGKGRGGRGRRGGGGGL